MESIYIDDRSFIANPATRLVERINHFQDWSQNAGLSESSKPRRDRLWAISADQQKTGASPSPESQCLHVCLICSTLCRELLLLWLVGATSYASANYETMGHGQSWTRHESQAHKWLRCLYGALDRLAGCNLVRVVMQFLRDGPLRWRKEAGAPWIWKQDSLVINLNDPFNGEAGEVLPSVRSGWRLACFDKFLHSKRHEAAAVQHATSTQLLNVDWEGVKVLADSNTVYGATLPSLWRAGALGTFSLGMCFFTLSPGLLSAGSAGLLRHIPLPT